MDCNVIQDLIPLYVDGCCSPESARAVQQHMKICPKCTAYFESLVRPLETEPISPAPAKLHRIQDWKASLLQSVLLFLSFGMITLGVALEARTPAGLLNGFWAFNLVIPATGFLLSLANWYFIRLYPSEKIFSTASLLATLGIILAADLWALFHYEINLAELLSNGFFETLHALVFLNGLGIFLTAALCALSKVLSQRYAQLLGKF